MSKTACLLLLLLTAPFISWCKRADKDAGIEAANLVTLGLGINSSNYAFKGQGLWHAKTHQNEGSMCLLSLSYARKVFKHSYFGLAVAADQQHGEWMTSNRPSSDPYYFNTDIGIFSRRCLTLAAEYRINGIVRKNFIIYTTIGVGATFYQEVRQYSPDVYLQGYINGYNRYGPNPRQVQEGKYFNGYASPIGIAAGFKQFQYFFEIGIGYKGLLHTGITCSF
jgi:hypothetical protein